YRWDSGQNLIFPDRNEYFWARADGRGKGPAPATGLKGETRVKYDEISVYTEGATGNIGVFSSLPYRTLESSSVMRGSGFSDMTIGTKTLLFDCELLQISFQFTTYLPIGNFRKGLGVGNVSLEPAILIGLKIGPDTYYQGEVAEWIPIAGDLDYAGA